MAYGSVTYDSSLLNCTGKTDYVLVGGYDSLGNENILLTAAFGHTSSVFTVVPNPDDDIFLEATLEDNGVWWYDIQTWSFGFADSQSVYLFEADIQDESSNTRLSWHLLGGEAGGFRLGSLIYLNSPVYDTRYWKVIYLVC